MTVMDDTEAAEPVLEHTAPAPTEDETQGIYAWSHDDETEAAPEQPPPRRSWKLPVTLAAVAAAGAITAGVVMAWPHARPTAPVAGPTPSTTTPTPLRAKQLPDAPPAPMNPDDRFIAKLKTQGWTDTVPNRQSAINGGHQVCTNLAGGADFPHVVHDILRGTDNINIDTATYFAETAIDAYCPQYAGAN